MQPYLNPKKKYFWFQGLLSTEKFQGKTKHLSNFFFELGKFYFWGKSMKSCQANPK